MTQKEAIIAAKAILKDDANELACMAPSPQWDSLPHRAKCAIQREISRIREISVALDLANASNDPSSATARTNKT